MLAQAATGTGKTAAFALPLLHLVVARRSYARADRGAGARADARARHAGRGGRAQVRKAARRDRGADLRRRVDGGADPHAQARRGRRGRDTGARARPHPAPHAASRRRENGRARRSRRNARHGIRRGSGGDPRGHAAGPPDRPLLRDPPAAHLRDRGDAPAHAGHDSHRAGGGRRRHARESAAGGVHRRAGEQDGRARPRARRRAAGIDDRVLPHAHRGRRAHGDAERARVSRARRCTAGSIRSSATA